MAPSLVDALWQGKEWKLPISTNSDGTASRDSKPAGCTTGLIAVRIYRRTDCKGVCRIGGRQA